MQNLDGREAFELQSRIKGAERLEHVGVITERQGWMESPHNMQFSDPKLHCLPRFLNNFLDRVLKSIRVPLLSCKRTKLAAQDAIVRVIDVAVDDVACVIAHFFAAREVRDRPNRVKIF